MSSPVQMMRRGLLVVAALILGSASATAAAYGAREILNARRRLYDTTYAWSDQHQVMRVTMVDAKARQQERTIELYERRYAEGGQLELYGEDAVIVKRIRQSDIKFVGSVPVPARVEVEDPRGGTKSTFDVIDIQVNGGFSEDVFSLPLLASPDR